MGTGRPLSRLISGLCFVWLTRFVPRGLGSDWFGFCWPGIRPGRRVTFIFRKMKVTKAKAPLLPASLRFAPGNLRCSVVGCTAKLSPLLRSSVRTDAVSQFTWQLHSSMQLLSPRPALLGACKRGGARNTEYRDSFFVGWALRPALMLYRFSMNLIAAGALQMRARGSKHLKQTP